MKSRQKDIISTDKCAIVDFGKFIFLKEMKMKIKKIHHVAYRCINAKQTVEWYRKYLNMDFVLAITENQVPLPSS